MLSYLFKYAATRVAGDAVDGIARRAVWGALAFIFLLTAFVLGLMIAFWTFEPIYGAIPTAAAIAAVCAALALLAACVPAIADWRRRRAEAAAKAASSAPGPVYEAASAVKEETEAAADYFGAVQVVASAFLFGLGAARQIRGR
jgi:hypothetical protein